MRRFSVPIEGTPEVARLMGCIIAQHAALLMQLQRLLAHLTGLRPPFDARIFYALPEHEKTQILKEGLAGLLPLSEAKTWAKFLDGPVERVTKARNMLAHHVMAAGNTAEAIMALNPRKLGGTDLTPEIMAGFLEDIAQVNDDLQRRIWILTTGVDPWALEAPAHESK